MKCIFLQEERTDNSGSSIEQNFLLELENFNSLNEALDDMVGYIPVSFLIMNVILFYKDYFRRRLKIVPTLSPLMMMMIGKSLELVMK